jgi:hypothetical protein
MSYTNKNKKCNTQKVLHFYLNQRRMPCKSPPLKRPKRFGL